MDDTAITEGGKLFFLEGRGAGTVLSRGFTCTASCMRPLGKYLNRA